MGIHPTSGGEHGLLAFSANAPQGFTQGQAHFPEQQGSVGHFLEGRPQRQRRGMHQAQVQVGVGAIATAVHQGRLGRQVGLVDQRVHRQVRQALGQARGG